MQVDKLVFR